MGRHTWEMRCERGRDVTGMMSWIAALYRDGELVKSKAVLWKRQAEAQCFKWMILHGAAVIRT